MTLDTRLTAFAIARARADESSLPVEQQLFQDSYAHLFDEPHADVSAVFALIPFFREQVRLRTRFFDDAVRAALVEGVRTVVLLGAGFDTRSLRLPELANAGANVIEIDYAQQLESKWQRLQQAGFDRPSFVTALAIDLGSDDVALRLERGLRASGVEPDATLLWAAEGLFGYLDRATLERLASATAMLSGDGSLFVANHFVPTWNYAALSDIFDSRGWQSNPGPSFAELHARLISGEVPAGSEQFAFWIGTR